MFTGTRTPEFNVVILHDSPGDGERANRLFQRLVDLFGSEYAFEYRLVKLDEMSTPAFAQEAAQNISRADMLIVSVGSEMQLTPEFKRWAQEWPPAARESDRLLVALLDRDKIESNPGLQATPFLRALAEQNGMDFLCNFGQGVPCRGRVAARLAGLTELSPSGRVYRSDRVVMPGRDPSRTPEPISSARWGLHE